MGAVEGALSLVADLIGGSEVDGRGGVHADAGVSVFVVVGEEEFLAERAGVLQ
ncbi:hypothetical protein [Saccharothrix lopnurensis]|uniref:Uncharacterized protein n=1 Tax=Saccharothrix lopnurensis TaxID=1670621 RepID=A0ABW1PC94_9PSEU